MENHLCFSKTLTLTVIPDELIFDNILPRLPVISLIRFKCVSKSWYYFICTPHFTISHFHFSSSLSPHFLLHNNKDDITLAYNDNRHDNLKQLVKLEQRPWDYPVQVVGCCNGLVCLFIIYENEVYSSNNLFIVWNPATRQHRYIISISPRRYPFYMNALGFGYYKVGSTDDYKIVAGFDCENCLWVFSLRVGLWKSVDFPSDDDDLLLGGFHNNTSIHIDGTLYWCASVLDSICIRIYSFSLIDEQFNQEVSFLRTPNMIIGEGFHQLLVFKGCLSLIWDSRDSSDVFVMKKEGDSTSWQKLFSIPRLLNVICLDFSITGKCLVEKRHIDGVDELKLVDITLEDLEHSPAIGFELGHVKSVHHYVESLVSPFTLM